MGNRKLRVLVVDDNEFIRTTLFEFLLYKGFEVGLAKDGQEGLYIFNNYSFDFVVTDYGMPHMNGLKMAKEIKKKHPDAVVILVSGDLKIKLRTRDVANFYLEKPFKFEEVYNLIVSSDKLNTQNPKIH